ncbi:hypothetical protein LCGC14_1682260, partial [marine sediment metagenome]
MKFYNSTLREGLLIVLTGALAIAILFVMAFRFGIETVFPEASIDIIRVEYSAEVSGWNADTLYPAWGKTVHIDSLNAYN